MPLYFSGGVIVYVAPAHGVFEHVGDQRQLAVGLVGRGCAHQVVVLGYVGRAYVARLHVAECLRQPVQLFALGGLGVVRFFAEDFGAVALDDGAHYAQAFGLHIRQGAIHFVLCSSQGNPFCGGFAGFYDGLQVVIGAVFTGYARWHSIVFFAAFWAHADFFKKSKLGLVSVFCGCSTAERNTTGSPRRLVV